MNTKLISSTLATAILTAFTAGATQAAEPNPYMRADGTWISISGEVTDVMPDRFVLDYGESVITVEMDDGDRDADAYKLLEGDKVTVNGMIDDDFYETTTIEAESVYVEKLGTYFYASAVDEEDTLSVWYSVPIDTSIPACAHCGSRSTRCPTTRLTTRAT